MAFKIQPVVGVITAPPIAQRLPRYARNDVVVCPTLSRVVPPVPLSKVWDTWDSKQKKGHQPASLS
jgi:hypothetical protein